MADIPSANTKTVWAAKASISCTNTYVSVKNLRFSYNYAILQETRIGNTDPIQGTGEFRGTIEFDFVACTDSDIHDWVTPATGQIASKTFSIAEVDTGTPTTRTWTVIAKMNEYSETLRENDFIIGRISGVLTDQPTEA